MAGDRTSKSIAERIDINYYKHPHPLRRSKQYASWVLFGASVLVLMVAALWGERRIYEAAPVSASHAFIANDCRACHTEPWAPARRLVLFDSNPTVPDAACQDCHNVTDHSTVQLAEEVPRCAACHREHRPADDLDRVADARCVECHRDVHTSRAAPAIAASVTDIETHAEFDIFRAAEPTDATRLKFNHQVHLPVDGLRTADGRSVTLTCIDCHEPAADGLGMDAVNYERHCASCHANALVFDADKFPGESVPHERPDLVRGLLRYRYAGQPENLAETAASNRTTAPSRGGLFGERFGVALSPDRTERLRQAEIRVFVQSSGCRYCHDVVGTSAGPDLVTPAPEPTSDIADSDAWAIVAPNMPDRWFEGGRFRHASHRMLGCAACHPAATSNRTSDILIPAIANCKECHRSAVRELATGRCVDCHDYHDHERDHDFDGPLSIESITSEE